MSRTVPESLSVADCSRHLCLFDTAFSLYLRELRQHLRSYDSVVR